MPAGQHLSGDCWRIDTKPTRFDAQNRKELAVYPDLFILRHGETEWNLLGKFQGRKNSPLTAKGKAQALKQRSILASIQHPPRQAFSSPQGRAVETAHLALGRKAKFELDSRIQEIDFGDWEGATRESIKTQIERPFESGLWNFQSPGGESFDQISERAQAFLNELTEPTILVTHGITSIVLRGIYMGLNQTELLRLSKDQGCVFNLSNGDETILR
jgi:broad specificity phosphatase PhoE